MKKNFLLWILLISVIILTSGLNLYQADNQLTKQEKEKGWKLLFDGKTLNGWRDYQGKGEVKGPWKVEDGLLTALGLGNPGKGYLVTEDQYENFIITFNWKIAEEGNSGILYHVIERPIFNAPPATGPEYQIIDELGLPKDREPWKQLGADYSMHAADPAKKKLKKAGEWNSSKIVFDNGHLEHWLNGKKILEFEAWTENWLALKSGGKDSVISEYGLARRGHFALQDHGFRVWFKDIKLKELPVKIKGESLSFNGKDFSGWDILGKEKWYVQDGIVVSEPGTGKGYGFMSTRKYYYNFDFTVDFKLMSDDANSGIFFRSIVENGPKGIRASSPAWQVEIEPTGRFTGAIYDSGAGGRGWLSPTPTGKEQFYKKNDWNTIRIKTSGRKVTTWLNGELITDIEDEMMGQGQGRVMLQIHSGGKTKVLWRNIHLRELE